MRYSTSPSCMIDDSAPRATLSMLADYLSPLTILQMPSGKHWALRGFIAVTLEAGLDEGISGDPQVLIICQSREAPRLLRKHSNSSFLIVHDGEHTLGWADDFDDRIMIVKKDLAYYYILFMVQEFFLNILFWSRRLADILQDKGSFQEMLDASGHILENHLILIDSSNSLLAYTRTSEAPEDISKTLIDSGFLSSAAQKSLGMNDPQTKSIGRRINKRIERGKTIDILVVPIKHLGNNFGTCLMFCDKIAITQGLQDYLSIFLDYVGRLCERMWKIELESKNPFSMMLVNIISGHPMEQGIVQARLRQLRIPENPQFKLVLIKNHTVADDKLLVDLMESAKNLNDFQSIPFRYGGDVLALLYSSKQDDGRFSIQTVLDNVDNEICKPYSAFAGTSQVFDRIEDLDLAYQQAKQACDYKDTIDLERSMFSEQYVRPVYAFEDVLIYYLIDKDLEKSRYRDFIFSHSFLDKIIARDEANGTDDFRLLWIYLNCDCNVSSTAKQLFMHRNTVIYHIDKIKDNFNLDFTDKSTRDRTMIDYKIKFLTASKAEQHTLASN